MLTLARMRSLSLSRALLVLSLCTSASTAACAAADEADPGAAASAAHRALPSAAALAPGQAFADAKLEAVRARFAEANRAFGRERVRVVGARLDGDLHAAASRFVGRNLGEMLVQPNEPDGPVKEIRGLVNAYFPAWNPYDPRDPTERQSAFGPVTAAADALGVLLPLEDDDGRRPSAEEFPYEMYGGSGAFVVLDLRHRELLQVVARQP